MPACSAGPPLPAIVTRPSTKSVGFSGSGSGSQRNWFGVAGASSKRLWSMACSTGWNGSCTAGGRIRYSQLRRLARRGERRARQLLRVEAVCHALRRVLPNRQGAGNRLAGKLVAEARLVTLAAHGTSSLQETALHLVALDRLEQRLEVALAEAFIALALDDF